MNPFARLGFAMLGEFRRKTWGWRQKLGQVHGTLFYLSYMLKTRNLAAGEWYTLRVPFLRSPLTLRAGTTDFSVLEQVFTTDELSFQLPSPVRSIVDAGANIGLVSVVLAERYPEATVVALEVDDGNFRLLEENTKPHKNVICVKKGLWSHETFLVIDNPDAEAWAFTVHEEPENPNGIPAIGVPDVLKFLNTDRIDLLKVDIEGSEVEVFSGDAQRWIDKVNVIAVELHDRFRPGCTKALEQATANQGFSWQEIGEYHVLQRI
jgi:FkbM family methyltransferase